MTQKKLALFDPVLIKPAILESFRKLDPRVQWRNPVMFVVYVGSFLTTLLWGQALEGHGEAPAGFILAVSLWLWFTVLFANFAEALAEGRSKAQAASLRGLKKETWAKKLQSPQDAEHWQALPATDLRKGDFVIVHTGEIIPA
ncbi:MAG: potassium-transporting ATPase subunit B, partial [Betaproteobacteria bacterium]|nr:potassium-transporting ATPase subunit B [Betaproteobacteria bacterium]